MMQIRHALRPTIFIASSLGLFACESFNALDLLEHWPAGDATPDGSMDCPVPDVLDLNGMAEPGVGLAAGSTRDCLLDSDGSIDCWGSDEYGQVQSFQPVTNESVPGALAVAVGGGHRCVLHADHSVSCWGANAQGQLGDGTQLHRDQPTAVQGLTGISAVVAGDLHTCALRDDGTAACWGNNLFGQLGDGMPSEIQTTPSDVSRLDHALALAVAATHSCAVREDGSVLCWGQNQDGQLGNDRAEPQPLPTFVPRVAHARGISVGAQFSCALIQGGTITCWGRVPGGEDIAGPTQIAGIRGATHLTAGYTHACALLSDQTVMCWGQNGSGQLGDGGAVERSVTPVRVANLTGVMSLRAAGDHTCSRLANGSVWCWGDPSTGQVGFVDSGRVPSPVLCESEDQQPCPGECATLAVDRKHCGYCGNACPEGIDCVDARCACPSGTVACDETCVDTSSNSEHCGACNSTCPTGATCVNGSCECPAGTTQCGAACVDLMTDVYHCGDCRNNCTFQPIHGEPPIDSCVAGLCACPEGLTACRGLINGQPTHKLLCVDTQNDPEHCGACQARCVYSGQCRGGECVCTEPCPPGAFCASGRCECPGYPNMMAPPAGCPPFP